MKLNDKTYDILKWIVIICLPALGSLYGHLAATWGLPYPDAIPQTVIDIETALGAILCISTAEYNSKH